MENTVNISAEKIEEFCTELFEKAGMSRSDASWYAKTLAMANLRGIDSHGILRASNYFDRMLCGAINPRANVICTKKAPAVTVVDGDDGAGPVVAKAAMESAIASAAECGIGMAAAYNSNHFGAAATYAQMAVDKGMIGISMTNVPTLVTAPGARAKVVGNNPVAIGIPTFNDYPFMLDMSMSVVAEGKLRFAAAKGSKIPTSWAADSEGNPTDDPEKALKGFLLPVGGFKGLGIAYAVDILCGVLTDGIFADKIKSMYRNPTESGKVSHAMIAINISAFISQEEMRERMKEYHEYLETVPLANGDKGLLFPGEVEYGCEKERKEKGVPVPVTTIENLRRLKGKYSLKSEI